MIVSKEARSQNEMTPTRLMIIALFYVRLNTTHNMKETKGHLTKINFSEQVTYPKETRHQNKMRLAYLVIIALIHICSDITQTLKENYKHRHRIQMPVGS